MLQRGGCGRLKRAFMILVTSLRHATMSTLKFTLDFPVARGIFRIFVEIIFKPTFSALINNSNSLSSESVTKFSVKYLGKIFMDPRSKINLLETKVANKLYKVEIIFLARE